MHLVSGHFEETTVLLDGFQVTPETYALMLRNNIKLEQQERRESFAARLKTYVPRRPRTYADRKWLEGYTLTAQHIHNFNGLMIPHVITSFVNTYAVPRFYLKLTAESRGAMDAFLDAVGC